MMRRRFTSEHPVRVSQVFFKNPPGPKGLEVASITVERQIRGRRYSRKVGPRGSLDAQEAAALFGVSRLGVYMAIREGRLKARKLRGRVMIPFGAGRRYFGRRGGLRSFER